MARFIYCLTALLLLIATTSQALPVFDAELAASPLMHEVRINYRGARKTTQD
jgi:hypothetical protein